MPQATFTPKYLNPPKGNARSASIKDSDGGYWGCHPGDLNRFTAGQPVTVEYSTSENNGKTYYNIKSIVGQQAPANPQAQRSPQDISREISRNNARMQPNTNPQAQDEAKKSENIFVTTVVQAAIARQYPLEERQLTLLVQMARSAWRGDAVSSEEPPFPGSPDDYGDVDPRG